MEPKNSMQVFQKHSRWLSVRQGRWILGLLQIDVRDLVPKRQRGPDAGCWLVVSETMEWIWLNDG